MRRVSFSDELLPFSCPTEQWHGIVHDTHIEWGMVGVGRHGHGRERGKRPRCIARVDKQPAKPFLLLAFFVSLFLIVSYVIWYKNKIRNPRRSGLDKINQQNVSCYHLFHLYPCYYFSIYGLLFRFSAKLVLIRYKIDVWYSKHVCTVSLTIYISWAKRAG
jgi:hypothetical protein